MALIINVPTENMATINVENQTDIQFAFQLEIDQMEISGSDLVISVEGKQVVLSNFFADDGTTHVETFQVSGGDSFSVDDFMAGLSSTQQGDGTELETAADAAGSSSGAGAYSDDSGDLFAGLTGADGQGDPNLAEGLDEQPPVIPGLVTEGGGEVIPYEADVKWQRGDASINAGSGEEGGATGDIKYRRATYRTDEEYIGSDGEDTLLMTDRSETLMLQDDIQDRIDEGIGYPDDGHARIQDIEVIQAGGGNDIIDLTSDHHTYGDVSVYGEEGNDTIWTNAGDDLLDGGVGKDFLIGGTGHDTLLGGDGNDIMKGGDGDDHIYGGNDNDVAYDGAGNDVLDMGNGNDLVHLGTGYDHVTLGDGADIVVVDQASLTAGAEDSLVVIRDFDLADGDELDLSNLDVLQVEHGAGDDYTAFFVADATDHSQTTWVVLDGVDTAQTDAIITASHANMDISNPFDHADAFVQQHLVETNSI